MLIDIYARSMMTATRHSCVQVRDLPAPRPKAQGLAREENAAKQPSGAFAKLAQRIKRMATGLRPTAHHLNQPVRCIDLQNL